MIAARVAGQRHVQALEQLGDLRQHHRHEHAHHEHRRSRTSRPGRCRIELTLVPQRAPGSRGSRPAARSTVLERAAGLAGAHHADVEVARTGRRCASASASEAPSFTRSRTSPSTVLRRGFSTCSVSAPSASTSGMPAPISVASWRVSEREVERRDRAGRRAEREAAPGLRRRARGRAPALSASSVRKTPSRRSLWRAQRCALGVDEAAVFARPAA